MLPVLNEDLALIDLDELAASDVHPRMSSDELGKLLAHADHVERDGQPEIAEAIRRLLAAYDDLTLESAE